MVAFESRSAGAMGDVWVSGDYRTTPLRFVASYPNATEFATTADGSVYLNGGPGTTRSLWRLTDVFGTPAITEVWPSAFADGVPRNLSIDRRTGSGLAASIGLGSGTTVTDASGNNNNTGTISGATWSGQGAAGNALYFDGSDDLVTVPDSATLDLTRTMTLAAWVYPTALNNWNPVLFKEQPVGLAYALYANTDTDRPGGFVFTKAEAGARGTIALPINTWSHLAATYDGAVVTLYVNGAAHDSTPASGDITTPNGALRIGGNTVFNDYI